MILFIELMGLVFCKEDWSWIIQFFEIKQLSTGVFAAVNCYFYYENTFKLIICAASNELFIKDWDIFNNQTLPDKWVDLLTPLRVQVLDVLAQESTNGFNKYNLMSIFTSLKLNSFDDIFLPQSISILFIVYGIFNLLML